MPLKTDSLILQFELQQVMNKPTHISADSFSWTELLFTYHPYMAKESSFQLCLHPKCDQNISYHCKSPETMWKLCLSTKVPHHETRWSYSILCSACLIWSKNLWLIPVQGRKRYLQQADIYHRKSYSTMLLGKRF